MGVVVLGRAGNQTEVFAGNLVSVYKPEVAQLPDCEAAIANRQHHPLLSGVVLGWAGDQTEIVGGTVVRVQESAVALLAYSTSRVM